MPSTTERYSAAASQSASTVEKIADFWTQGSQRLSDHMLPGLPQVDLVPVVERYFEFVQRTVDISRNLTLSWAEAAGTLSGAVREQAESMGGLVREQAGRPATSYTSRPARPSRPPASRPGRSSRPSRSWPARPAGPTASRPGAPMKRPASATRA